MSFKFPSLKSIQDSLPKVDLENLTKSISNVNASKAVQDYSDLLKDTIQPFASRTQTLIATQMHQVQQLAATHYNTNVEVSELPADYLELEHRCDLLLKLYTDLIHITSDTYGKVSYDYPPGSNSFALIRDANVGSIIGSKFNQLRAAATPQELERALLGGGSDSSADASATAASSNESESAATKLPKTLYHELHQIASTNGTAFESSTPVGQALQELSAAYLAVGDARLEQDKQVMTEVNAKLVSVLNDEFIKVTELRKRVYLSRLQFDLIRAEVDAEAEEENEELIAREDELVNATEAAVLEMKKLLKPAKNVSLLKVLVHAQRDYHAASAKRLAAAADALDKIDIAEDDDDEE